ncbi:MAG: tRNA (adenosine(37)-N6)-threonylcarbamoyltransferase complex transferase subunit TsaD [Mariniphaga sp.]
MDNNIILGIETSCDDTAVALVDEKGNVLSSVTSSQIEIHNEFGGIYPEFAARAHIHTILPTIEEALKIANIQPSMLKAIGVTRGPGLIGSLLVGLNTATALGLGWNIPVIGINHLRGHLRSADLEEQRITYPALVMLVSGGHTILSLMKNQTDIIIIGSTRDDSVGEAYDKVARMLKLGYPGGPIVDKLAKSGIANIPFPRPMIDKGFEFSFSGLKSAVSRYMNSETSIVNADVAASFVEAVMEILIKKSHRALKQFPVKSFVIVGGVAASPQLREQAAELSSKIGVDLCLPPLRWATDNGAMIALATWDYIKLGINTEPIPQLELSICDF